MRSMNPWRAIRRFVGAEQGAIAIEFSFVISILVVTLMGCYEASRYILIHQKLDRTSSSVADLVAQSDGMSVAILNDFYKAADEQTLPFDLTTKGRVIVTSIFRPDSNPAKVVWQCQGGGSYGPVTSSIGAKNADAVLPANFSVNVGENIIVAEVFYDYAPSLFPSIRNIGGMQFDLFQPAVFKHTTFARPRGSSLTTDPGC